MVLYAMVTKIRCPTEVMDSWSKYNCKRWAGGRTVGWMKVLRGKKGAGEEVGGGGRARLQLPFPSSVPNPSPNHFFFQILVL